MHNNWLPGADWSQVPFLDRMGWVFLVCVVVMFVLSIVLPDEKKGLVIDASMFKVDRVFAIGAATVFAILLTLYTVFW